MCYRIAAFRDSIEFDMQHKLKKIVGSNIFSAQFIKIISNYKQIGYNIHVLKQTGMFGGQPNHGW